MATDKEIYGYLANLKLLQIAGYDFTLGHAARRVLMILTGYANHNGSCFPSISQMSRKCGLSRTAVHNQIKNLVRHEYISKKNQFHASGGKAANLYQLNLQIVEQYRQVPEIFCKSNVISVVTYYAILQYYMTMYPYLNTYPETLLGGIKKPTKKTITNKKTANSNKQDERRHKLWLQDKNNEKITGITASMKKEQEELFNRVTKDLSSKKSAIIDIKINKQTIAKKPKNKLETFNLKTKVLESLEAEPDKIKQYILS